MTEGKKDSFCSSILKIALQNLDKVAYFMLVRSYEKTIRSRIYYVINGSFLVYYTMGT